MNRLLLVLAGCGLVLRAWGAADLTLPGLVQAGGATFRSGTGQFVVGMDAAPSVAARPRAAAEAGGSSCVDLEPRALVLTCERIKAALLGELAVADRWQGRVYVVINPGMVDDQPPLIGARRFADGWGYRVEVPRRLDPLKLVRGLAQALLLEFANRRAGARSAEIPLWLLEGMALHLARSSLIELVIPGPNETVNRVEVRSLVRSAQRPDPLAEARERLQTHAAMSLLRLGEMTAETLPVETWKTFQASAQLLVSQLLLLPQGRPLLAEFIARLPESLNWQSAFLASHRALFPRMVDAEKWWSVVLLHFTGLDALNAWSLEVAWAKLDDALRPPAVVRVSDREPPVRRPFPLQDIARDWDYVRQRLMFKGVVAQLALLRVKMPPEVAGLTDRYRQLLEGYLERRDRSGISRLLAGPSTATTARLVEDLRHSLDALDDQRRALRTAPEARGSGGREGR